MPRETNSDGATRRRSGFPLSHPSGLHSSRSERRPSCPWRIRKSSQKRLIFRRVVLRRLALDRHLEVFTVGIIDLGNTGAVVEHAAGRLRAQLACQHAARPMRKRRGVDVPTFVCSRRRHERGARADDDETDDHSPQHAKTLARDATSWSRHPKDGRRFRNHADGDASMDLFVVPTISFRPCDRQRMRLADGFLY